MFCLAWACLKSRPPAHAVALEVVTPSLSLGTVANTQLNQVIVSRHCAGIHCSLTGWSSRRQPVPGWCPPLASLLAARLTVGVRPLCKYTLEMSVASGKSLAVLSMAKPCVLPRLGVPAITPTGARHRSGSGNAITELGRGREYLAQPGCRVSPWRGHPLQPNIALQLTLNLAVGAPCSA